MLWILTRLSLLHPGDDPAVDGDDAVQGAEAARPGRGVRLHLVDHKVQPELVATEKYKQ